MNKYINLGKIFFVLLISFFVSNLMIGNVFLADTPRVRPNLDQYFIAKIVSTKDNFLAKFSFDFSLPKFNLALNGSNSDSGSTSNWFSNNNSGTGTRQAKMDFLKSTLKPITKGVSAASKDGYNYIEFRMNEIEWVRITYTLKNGKVVNIQYPKGTNPPPQAIYENQNE